MGVARGREERRFWGRPALPLVDTQIAQQGVARALAAGDGDEGDVALLVDGLVAVAGVRPARVALAEGRDLKTAGYDVVRRRRLSRATPRRRGRRAADITGT